MGPFQYKYDELFCEDVPLTAIADEVGTPVYVYSRGDIERAYKEFDAALEGIPHEVCYAVKANSTLGVLGVLVQLGAGADIVSIGELYRWLRAGGDADSVVFSGVGKTEGEMKTALEAGIGCFNVESGEELLVLDRVATSLGKRAKISLRVNPDVDPETHPYISTGLKQNKFGVEIADAEKLYEAAAKMPGVQLCGIACHIGSQLQDLAPFMDALDRVLALTDRLELRGIRLSHLDVGGGLGVRYHDETPPLPADLAAAVRQRVGKRPLRILMEPGRAIAGNAGVLLTRVEYLKNAEQKNFAIVDAAMNDLLRPALYQAWHTILPVQEHSGTAAVRMFDIVGPVCESGDWLGRDRALSLNAGDLLAIRTAGAYGFTMSSNYNTRPRAAEVMVDGANVHLVRARETVEDLLRGEELLP